MDNRGSIDDFYELDGQKLGEGAFGYVCRGVSRESGKPLAIKSLSKAHAKNVRRRFRQEVAIMKMIDHPNIIKLVETFETKTHMYLVMELCTGGDLYQRLSSEGPFPEAGAAVIMQQILRPVCYMHQQRVCHRDVKPENFLFLTDGPVEENTLKIIDFGLSCTLEPDRLLSTKLGTPRYSSPQVLAGSYDEGCDLWSCGVIMYVLLSGQPPFGGRNDAEVMQSVRRGNYAFSGPLWRGVSEDAKDLIRSLLKYQPQDRLTAERALAHGWIEGRAPRAQGGAGLRPSIIMCLREFCAQGRLRQAALQLVAQHMPDEETRAFQREFAALDARGNGVLTLSELGEHLLDSEPRDSSAEIQRVMEELKGDDSSASVGYTDFLAATLDPRRFRDGVCRAAFRAFDRNGDGRISRDELELLLEGAGPGIDPGEQIARLLQEADANRDGVIDFHEFRSMLAGGPA
eukprot:CAMPEP_0168415366 /NCGR_PEP_ID=MMETSP0228-20121227/30197_1 /TAXON_ID=133427 /ORGANISM="Protoceratium reticulatum, Strain CCCM 535 (=CCMP 1889)" /LENGTH=457 /DNA_ID=CAMNT_0008429177 /DNA_START=9 /DNA_END=1379 /DNA_ORIENTATION=-